MEPECSEKYLDEIVDQAEKTAKEFQHLAMNGPLWTKWKKSRKDLVALKEVITHILDEFEITAAGLDYSTSCQIEIRRGSSLDAILGWDGDTHSLWYQATGEDRKIVLDWERPIRVLTANRLRELVGKMRGLPELKTEPEIEPEPNVGTSPVVELYADLTLRIPLVEQATIQDVMKKVTKRLNAMFGNHLVNLDVYEGEEEIQ